MAPPRAMRVSVATVEDLVQYAAETERHVRHIEEIVADDALAERLGCRPGQRWLNVKMLRTEPDEGPAICWTEVYLDPVIGPAHPPLRQARGERPDLRPMQAKCGVVIVDITQTMRAVNVDRAAGAGPGLRARRRGPWEITRHYKDSSGRVYRITHRAPSSDRFQYRLGLQR